MNNITYREFRDMMEREGVKDGDYLEFSISGADQDCDGDIDDIELQSIERCGVTVRVVLG